MKERRHNKMKKMKMQKDWEKKIFEEDRQKE